MLEAGDTLTFRPRRILVAGVSGAGKSTLCRRIANALDVPYTETDGLFHGPGWTPRPEFLDDVDAFTAAEAWICEWQYPVARPRLADRADLLVWLDPPFRLVLSRVVRRTYRRRRHREVLWNGNVEPPLRTFFTDPEHIVRWAINTRRMYHRLVPDLARTHPGLTVVRLRSVRDIDHWMESLPSGRSR